MSVLQLIYAPNAIFKKKAEKVAAVDDVVRKIIDDMFETLEFEKAVGIGANMVGVLKRIIVVNLQENGKNSPQVFVNPMILSKSDEVQKFEEASLCFPGISAEITRPKEIKISYLDYDGRNQELVAEGFLSAVIQHEMEYIDGKNFLDNLSKMKRDMLIKKMLKFQKLNKPHVHGASCNH